MICPPLKGGRSLQDPSAPNVLLISSRGGKEEQKLCRSVQAARRTKVLLTHAHVLESGSHLSAGRHLRCALSLLKCVLARARRPLLRVLARDVRRRQRSRRADGVCQRDARAWRGEARGRSAHDASRQHSVENFRGKTRRRSGTSATGARGDPTEEEEEEEDERLTWLCAAAAALRRDAAPLTPDLRLEEEFQEPEQNSSWTSGIGERPAALTSSSIRRRRRCE